LNVYRWLLPFVFRYVVDAVGLLFGCGLRIAVTFVGCYVCGCVGLLRFDIRCCSLFPFLRFTVCLCVVCFVVSLRSGYSLVTALLRLIAFFTFTVVRVGLVVFTRLRSPFTICLTGSLVVYRSRFHRFHVVLRSRSPVSLFAGFAFDFATPVTFYGFDCVHVG